MKNPKYIFLLLAFILSAIMLNNVLEKRNTLQAEGESIVVKIVKLENKRKGSTTSVTRAHYEFKNQEGRLLTGYRDISNNKVKIGRCYQAIYVPSNPNVIKVNFGKTMICPN